MKKLLLLLILTTGWSFSHASGTANPSTLPLNPIPGSISLNELIKLTPRQYEKITGKKLKLKERIALKVFQWKLKKKMKAQATPEQLRLGRLSLIFGLVAIVTVCIAILVSGGILLLLAIGSAIAGFVLGISSLKGNNNGPGLLGLIFSSIVLFLFLLFIAVVLGSVTYN